MIKTFNIVLDIEKDLYNPSNLLFTVSESDLDSIDLLFTIMQDDQNLDLTGSTLEIGIKKPSGLTVYQELEITNAIEGAAVVRMSLQSYNEYGVYTAEVYIRGIDTLAVTSPFYYSSREAIINDGTLESTNDWSAFQQALFSYDKKPVLTNGVPDFVPDYIGQMAFDTTGQRAFIANDLTVLGWQLLAAGEGGGGGLVSWADILGKPSLYPPEAHLHLISDVTDLQAALDSKQDIGTTAPAAPAEPVDWVDITGKPDTFRPAAHIHNISDVTGLQGELDSKLEAIPPEYLTETEGDTRYAFKGEGGTGTGGGTLVEDLLTSTSTTAALSANQGRVLNESKSDVNHNHNDLYASIIHTHSVDDVEGLSSVLNSKVDDVELAAYLTEVEGDARYQQLGTDTTTIWGGIGGTLADQADITAALNSKADNDDLTGYAPVTHTHDFTSITDKPATYPPSAHLHVIADVTGLEAALGGKADDADLAGKSDIGHTHDFTSITDKPATYPATAHTHDFTTDITGKPATYPPSTHTHDYAAITNKPATFVPQIMTGGQIGGAMVGNGLAMSGNYLTVKQGASLGVAADNSLQVQTTGGAALKFWTGNSAAYTAIATKDANTLYFISG